MPDDTKILLGLVRNKEGQISIEIDKDVPLPEVVRYYGILMAECPFMFQYMKQQARAAEKPAIITPSN